MATQTLPDLKLPVRDVAEPVCARLLEVETVFQGMARLRLDPEARRCVYFYVTDTDERLVGVAPARRLLFADPAALVGEIMEHPALSVAANEMFGNALAFMAEQRLLALPMVDEENRLSGVLDISTFTHTLWHEEQRRQAEEAFQMAGVHLSSCNSAPEREDRSSWLWTTAVAALLLPLVVSGFRDTLSRFLPIAFFIPLVMLLAGSVALRTIARRLLLGRTGAQPGMPLRAELRAGGALAGIVAVVAAIFSKDLRIALVVGCGVPAALITGAAAGYSVPRVLQRWRQARVASGPSVLALAAAAALCCYLALAAAILR